MSDPLMEIAWLSFMKFASESAEILADFNTATGRNFMKPASAIEKQIDRVTGKWDDDADAFVLWVTEHYWGVDEAPEKVREAIAANALEEAKEVRPS